MLTLLFLLELYNKVLDREHLLQVEYFQFSVVFEDLNTSISNMTEI